MLLPLFMGSVSVESIEELLHELPESFEHKG